MSFHDALVRAYNTPPTLRMHVGGIPVQYPSHATLNVGCMAQHPWTRQVFRDRHGRGQRKPMFGTRLPRYRTRSGVFDNIVASQIKRLNEAWPNLVGPIQFAVEDVPPSDPVPWDDDVRSLSNCFPSSHGIPARIVLYRMAMQMQVEDDTELQLLVRDEMVSRLAELYGRRAEEIDPQWGLWG